MNIRLSLCLIFILLVFASGCTDFGVLPIESDNPTIVYSRTGGFWGTTLTVALSPGGEASLRSLYPVLRLQLTGAELDSLRALLTGFGAYDDSYSSPGLDYYKYIFLLTSGGRQKSVTIEGAYFFYHSSALPLLQTFIGKMDSLAARIYDEKATWIGLTYQFGLDCSSYVSGDSIRALCRVINSTGLLRSLYFRNNYRLQLYVNSVSPNWGVAYSVPDLHQAWFDTSAPSRVDIPPGQQVELSLSWDQTYSDAHGILYPKLPPGAYFAVVDMLAGPTLEGGYYSSDNISFQISNP